jgi:hypothetical protein
MAAAWPACDTHGGHSEGAALPQSRPSLYVATPCYGGGAQAIYLRSLLALEAACAERGPELQVELGGGEALISRARACMMARFLRSGAGHLLFVDADIGFEPEDVFRLLEADKPVIGGVYPRRRQPGGRVSLELEPFAGESAAHGRRRVRSIGAGFLMIRRDAAERLAAAYPQLRAGMADVAAAGIDSAVMLFDSFVEPETRRYLSDYEAFCRRWRDLGGEVWADAGCRLRHLGEILYAAGEENEAPACTP